jgi:thiol-disulfide isomerase/thioredoxin
MLRFALFLLCGALSYAANVEVFIFVRTDCPITNRYAPELLRIAKEFQGRNVAFYLVYPDPNENKRAIENHMAEYGFPGTPLRDPDHKLEQRAHATVAPEAAVFDAAGNLKYHGRIDDRFPSPGVAKPAAQVHDLEDAIFAVLAGKPVAHPETRAVGCSLIDLH